MGENHGYGHPGGFFVVSEALAIKQGEVKWACRLLTRTTLAPAIVPPAKKQSRGFDIEATIRALRGSEV